MNGGTWSCGLRSVALVQAAAAEAEPLRQMARWGGGTDQLSGVLTPCLCRAAADHSGFLACLSEWLRGTRGAWLAEACVSSRRSVSSREARSRCKEAGGHKADFVRYKRQQHGHEYGGPYRARLQDRTKLHPHQPLDIPAFPCRRGLRMSADLFLQDTNCKIARVLPQNCQNSWT